MPKNIHKNSDIRDLKDHIESVMSKNHHPDVTMVLLRLTDEIIELKGGLPDRYVIAQTKNRGLHEFLVKDCLVDKDKNIWWTKTFINSKRYKSIKSAQQRVNKLKLELRERYKTRIVTEEEALALSNENEGKLIKEIEKRNGQQ